MCGRERGGERVRGESKREAGANRDEKTNGKE